MEGLGAAFGLGDQLRNRVDGVLENLPLAACH
jgi:hypothetical protein